MMRTDRFFFRPGAFSLPEMIISMGASVIILGALLLSSLSLQKSLHGSEVYAGSYSDQRRLIDYLGRDLRRAIGVSATDANGVPRTVANETIDIADRATLTLQLPGYYQSDEPGTAGFDQPLPVVVAPDIGPGYGTESGAAATVTVTFRKVYLASQKCICFVRDEATAEQVIVRGAENLHVQVTLDTDGRTGLVNVWFRAPYSGPQPLVSTYDEVMLRNIRLDQPQ